MLLCLAEQVKLEVKGNAVLHCGSMIVRIGAGTPADHTVGANPSNIDQREVHCGITLANRNLNTGIGGTSNVSYFITSPGGCAAL